MPGEPYQRASVDGSYDAIVVGSGIGGLSAAALLARHAGYRVLVLERHYTLGGFTHTFRRPGYEWDVGVHYIGDIRPGSLFRALFDEVGDGTLEWADMGGVYDRVVLGNDHFDFRTGRDAFRRDLKDRFPAEAAAIDEYLRLVEYVNKGAWNFFMEKALPAPIAAVAGPVLRRRFLKFASRTTRHVLESLTDDQRLIGILTSQWCDYGLPPARSSFGMHALVAQHYMEGAFYPVGGSARIAESILPVIADAGGRALVRAEVAEIVVEAGRAAGVRLASDGAVLRAPLVISDAGAANTFRRLLAPDVAASLGVLPRLDALEPSMGHLCLYVGLPHSAEELGLPRANLWVYPDEDHERTYEAMHGLDPGRRVVYISFPAAKDPDFERRHPGRSTIDVITLASSDAFADWEGTRWMKRGDAYEALKHRIAEQLLDVLYRHVPQTRGKVGSWELSTPLTTRHFGGHPSGEIYGLAHTPRRVRQRWLRPRTGVPGLYLTGQDAATAGVAGALMGGALCASSVLGKNLVGRIVRNHGATRELGRVRASAPASRAPGR